jgi:RNA polymerase-binding transcription factor DksA
MTDEVDALNERAAVEAEWIRRDQEVMAARRASQPQLTFCEDCEEDLPPLRLQLHCPRCIDCQRAFERRSRQYREAR